MKKPLKAYQATNDYEGRGCIIFAKYNAEARRLAINQLDGNEVDSCCRAPDFDKYAPGPVSPLILIEHGWMFECSECGRKVTEGMREDVADEGLDHDDFVPREDGTGGVFCSEACENKWHNDKQLNAEARKELERIFLEKFPGSTVIDVYAFGTNLENNRPGVPNNFFVSFEFPGSSRTARWYYNQEDCFVGIGDIEAFKAWRASTKAAT
jgi:hypothetical protein